VRIGVDLGGTKIEGILLDDQGREQARKRVATPRGDYPGTVRAIVDLVRGLEQAVGRNLQEKSVSVGVGIPGVVSPRTGLVKNANSTWLIGQPFDRDLAEALGRPVRIENDANCMAVSEAVDGAGAGARVVFAVILGTGCGGGIVVEGKPLSGRNAIAGEWGHNPLPWPSPDPEQFESPGPDCYCGQKGCLETYVSGPGLAADHQRVTGQSLSPEEVVRRAEEEKDPAALATLARFEHRLARGLTAVINLLDPDVIVLAGGISRIRRLYDHLPPLIARQAFSDGIDTPIRPAQHGDASGVRGAAWLWPPGSFSATI
jgi:fructokinase